MCRRMSSSGNFSSADRLISSIKRRCKRTLASSSLSVSNGLGAAGAGGGLAEDVGGSGATSGALATDACSGAFGKTVQDTSSVGGDTPSLGETSAKARRVEKRLIMRLSAHQARSHHHRGSLCPRQAEFLRDRWRRGFFGARRRDQFLELDRDVVAGLHLLERNAAIDRFAHQTIVVGDRGEGLLAERLHDVTTAQPRPEQPLLITVDNDLRRRPFTQSLAHR